MSVSVSSLSGPGDGSMASVTTLPGAGSLSGTLAGIYGVPEKMSCREIRVEFSIHLFEA